MPLGRFTFKYKMTDIDLSQNVGIYYDFQRNKLRMLEENESELSMQTHEQSLEAERQRISSVSFVEDLDKYQLFESLFANNSDNNVSDTDTSINDTNKSSHIEV